MEAQNAAPRWYLDKAADYPDSRFISAVGDGTSEQDARLAATAGVSLFFNTSTEVRNQAIRDYNDALSNTTTDFSQKTYIREDNRVSSDAEFLGLRYTGAFYEQGRKRWFVLAYIDRREAAAVYEAKIKTAMTAIGALSQDAAGSGEPLYAAALYYRAVKLAGAVDEWIKTAVIIDPAARTRYAATTQALQTLRSNYRRAREGVSFGVQTSSADFAGRVERALAALLEDAGFLVAETDPAYLIRARVTANEEQYDAGVFIRPGLRITLERGGRALFSYSKNFTRYGHKSLDGAYNRAFLAIEADLEENFLPRLQAMVGL
jgi:hypothetical protein